jgi:phosphate-selective porin OprO/OprP
MMASQAAIVFVLLAIPAVAHADDGTLQTVENRVKVGTFLQADARYFGDDPAQLYVDQYTFRSLRLQVDAALNDHVAVRILPDFAGGKTVIQDAYVDLAYLPGVTIRVGKQKVPFGLERLETEGTTILAERGLPTQVAPNRDIGATLYGDPAPWLSWQLGIFNGEADGTLVDGDQTDQKEGAARVLFRPLPCWGKSRGLQLGAAVTYGTAEGTTASPDLPAYKTSGQSTFASFDPMATSDGRRERVTGQAMWFGGPVGAMAEYVRSVERVKLGTARADVTVDAWQVAGQWVVTGEDASYSSVVPLHPFDPAKGDWGAVDVTARVDELRVVDDGGVLDPAKAARRAVGYTAGADWFWSKYVRLDLDVERTQFRGGAKTGDRPHEDLVLGRMQVTF